MLAALVVAAEMAIISYVRHLFMETLLLSSAFQMIVGGAAVFAGGVLIGSA